MKPATDEQVKSAKARYLAWDEPGNEALQALVLALIARIEKEADLLCSFGEHHKAQLADRDDLLRRALPWLGELSFDYPDAVGADELDALFVEITAALGSGATATDKQNRQRSTIANDAPGATTLTSGQSYREWCPYRNGQIRCALDLDHEGPCDFGPLPAGDGGES